MEEAAARWAAAGTSRRTHGQQRRQLSVSLRDGQQDCDEARRADGLGPKHELRRHDGRHVVRYRVPNMDGGPVAEAQAVHRAQPGALRRRSGGAGSARAALAASGACPQCERGGTERVGTDLFFREFEVLERGNCVAGGQQAVHSHQGGCHRSGRSEPLQPGPARERHIDEYQSRGQQQLQSVHSYLQERDA